MPTYIYIHIDIPLLHLSQSSDILKLITEQRSMWLLFCPLIKRLVIIWSIRMEYRLHPGYELSLGNSLARVGRLGAEKNFYL